MNWLMEKFNLDLSLVSQLGRLNACNPKVNIREQFEAKAERSHFKGVRGPFFSFY